MKARLILSLDYADLYQVGRSFKVYSPIALVGEFTDQARAERYARQIENEWSDEWSPSRRHAA